MHVSSKHTSWGKYFDRPMTLKDLVKRVLAHFEYLVLASARVPVLEIGTGSGAHAIFLSYFIPFVVSIDNDWEVLLRAKKETRHFRGRVGLVCADARAMPFQDNTFEVGILQGFYEHFTNDELSLMVIEQLRVCPHIISSVPSDHYPRFDYGNERLMPPSLWLTTLRDAMSLVEVDVQSRYYYFDPESWLYSLKALKWLGHFHELITLRKDVGR